MPSLHNPTGVSASPDRRQRLVTLARRAGIPILEDDPYGALAEPGEEPLIARDAQHVVYLSSFSKTIAPSLRLGWLVAPRPIYERLLLRKQSYDMASSLYVQAAVCDFLERAYDAHVAELRTALARRRRVALDAIERYWAKSVRFSRAAGGFYLWVTAPRDLRARALLDAAERAGASFLFGEAFFAQTGGDHNFRLALTAVALDNVAEGIRRIGTAIDEAFAR
jgi:2-aminoadipate transaminase